MSDQLGGYGLETAQRFGRSLGAASSRPLRHEFWFFSQGARESDAHWRVINWKSPTLGLSSPLSAAKLVRICRGRDKFPSAGLVEIISVLLVTGGV